MKASMFVLVALLGAIAAAACRTAVSEPGSSFSIDYPQWNKKKSGDRLNVYSSIRDDRQCYFDLDAANAPIDAYNGIVRRFMEKKGAQIRSDNPLSYEFRTADGKYTFLAKTRSLFCGKKTYLATVTCLKDNYDGAAAAKVFDSMRCGNAPSPESEHAGAESTKAGTAGLAARAAAGHPLLSSARASAKQSHRKPKLGIIASPAGKFDAKNVAAAFRLAKDSGADITRYYLSWTDVEKKKGHRNWKGSDFMIDQMRKAGLRASVAIHTIRTAVRGPLPSDLKFRGWDDPEFIARFTDFMLALLQRYGDVVDYLEIGSEVNAYLANHPEEVEPYGAFFKAVYKNVKPKYPGISIGMVFAYRELKENNAFSIYKRLALGDHDSFTLYVFTSGFAFTRKPSVVFEELKDIERLTGNRHFALEEVGWSTSPMLKGSDADQLAAVRAFFDYRDQAPARLDFMNWFDLHDGRDVDCDKIAKTFSRKGDALSRNRHAMKLFSEFLCHFGLRKSDGTPRPAWAEWVKRAKDDPSSR